MIEDVDADCWMLTYTGRQFRPLAPEVESIDIEDIAHGLAGIYRFGGQSPIRMTVAEHSLRVCRLCEPFGLHVQLWGLLHDAAEAYLGDCIRPLKHRSYFEQRGVTVPFVERFDTAEKRILRRIAQKWDLPCVVPEEINQADNLQLDIECDCLWPEGFPGLPAELRQKAEAADRLTMDPCVAKIMFLRGFTLLNGQRAAKKKTTEDTESTEKEREGLGDGTLGTD